MWVYTIIYLDVFLYCLTCSSMLNWNSADFTKPNSHQRINQSLNRNAAWVSNRDEYRNSWVLTNVFWINIRFVRELWNINLLDTHLDLFNTYIPSTHFVCLQDVFQDVLNNFSSSKTSSRRPKDKKLLCWRRVEGVFKTCLEDVFRTSSGHPKDQQMFAGSKGSWSIQIFLEIQKFIILLLLL